MVGEWGSRTGLLRVVIGGLPEEMEGGPTVGRGSTLDLVPSYFVTRLEETSEFTNSVPSCGLATAAPEATSRTTPEKTDTLMIIQKD